MEKGWGGRWGGGGEFRRGVRKEFPSVHNSQSGWSGKEIDLNFWA